MSKDFKYGAAIQKVLEEFMFHYNISSIDSLVNELYIYQWGCSNITKNLPKLYFIEQNFMLSISEWNKGLFEPELSAVLQKYSNLKTDFCVDFETAKKFVLQNETTALTNYYSLFEFYTSNDQDIDSQKVMKYIDYSLIEGLYKGVYINPLTHPIKDFYLQGVSDPFLLEMVISNFNFRVIIHYLKLEYYPQKKPFQSLNLTTTIKEKS